VWDRLKPERSYWVTYTSLYAVDLGWDKLAIEKLATLPHPERRKSIFSYPSENNVLMIKDLNSRDYAGELYFVDLRKEPGEKGFLFHYPWKFEVDHPKHKLETEFGFHDIYFRRTPDDSYIFNFGSAGSVGEPLFFEAPLRLDRAKLQVCYPDDKLKIPYYSHPAWNHDGRLVSYFGCEEPGPAELNPGWHIRDHGARKDVALLISGWVGGHIAWDGYDDDWIFAAISSKRFKPEWHGWIAHAYLPERKVRKLVRHYSRMNGGKSNYAALPRPAQSPDGTKCLYHSTMLQTTDQTMDLYIAVSHRPAPPVELKATAAPEDKNAVQLSWTPPRVNREIRGYRVYRSSRPTDGFSVISKGPVTGGEFRDAGSEPGQTRYYFVTSEEHSGLESDRTSAVVAYAPGRGQTGKLKPLVEWDKARPTKPSGLKCEWVEGGRAVLAWPPSDSRDVRYYNIYYSDEDAPRPVQAARLVSPGSEETRYADWGLDPEKASHFYAITVVDWQGNESEPTFARLDK